MNSSINRTIAFHRATTGVARFIVALIGVCMASGCSLLSFNKASDAVPAPHQQPDYAQALDQVARNLVYTLVQLPGLHPQRTLVQVNMNDPRPFTHTVIRRLSDAGYAIQKHTGQSADLPMLDASLIPIITDNTGTAQFGITIGTVTIRRVYEYDEHRAIPVSGQSIIGVPDTRVTLNDEDLPAPPNQLAISTVSFDQHSVPVVPALGAAQPAEPAVFDGQSIVHTNLYDTLTSNYEPLFAQQDYRDVLTRTIVFGNDSMVLGELGRAAVSEIADKLDVHTDLISVIGCSHGNTAIDNGNEILALGRSNRVKEAFLYAGVPQDKVLEEACWSGIPFDEVMPRRGVVISLKRRGVT